MSAQDDIKKLIINYTRRLQALKERQALYGLETPVAILTEIQDIEVEIEKLQTELNALDSEIRSPAQPDTTPASDSPKKAKTSRPPSPGSINIKGNVGSGTAIGAGAQVQAQYIAGGDITVGPGTDAVTDAFARIYQAIEAGSFADEATAAGIKETIEFIKMENEKGDEANETLLKFRFKMLAQMAPDVFEVAISTLANPALGLGPVVRKIARRAKEEQAKS